MLLIHIMKRFFILLFVLSLMVSCTNRQYRIDGIYTVEDGTPVWLIDSAAKDLSLIHI